MVSSTTPFCQNPSIPFQVWYVNRPLQDIFHLSLYSGSQNIEHLDGIGEPVPLESKLGLTG